MPQYEQERAHDPWSPHVVKRRPRGKARKPAVNLEQALAKMEAMGARR